MMLPDVIGHDNQSQHYQHHRCLCLDLSGRITTPDKFSYHTGLTILQMFQIKRAYPQSMNFRGLPWDLFVGFVKKLMASEKIASTR